MAFLRNVLFDTQTLRLIEMVYADNNELKEGTTFIQADATISESYALSSAVTKYPVEKGARLSDHASRDGFKINMSGIISDASMSYSDTFDSILSSPLGSIGNSFAGSNLKTRSQKGYDTLTKWIDEATPLIVKTHYAKDGIKSVAIKSNAPFIIESLSIPRDKSTGQALRFELSLSEIMLVTINKTNLLKSLSDKGAQSLITNNKSAAADAKNQAQKRTVDKLVDNAKAQNQLEGYTRGQF